MEKNSLGRTLVILFSAIGIIYIIGAIGDALEPKCIKSGCNNTQASGSSYCYIHKPYVSSPSSNTSSSYSNKSSSNSASSVGETSSKSSSKSSNSNSTSYSNKKKTSSTYDSYDDGYDDIYYDGDYDYDRYDWDSDYADGVDDAMDEFGEDWQVVSECFLIISNKTNGKFAISKKCKEQEKAENQYREAYCVFTKYYDENAELITLNDGGIFYEQGTN